MKLPRLLSPEGIGIALETAIRFGLVSGAAVAIVLGQLLVGLVLAFIAIGMFLRVWRLRRSKSS